jgi:hypothetical protein
MVPGLWNAVYQDTIGLELAITPLSLTVTHRSPVLRHVNSVATHDGDL